MKIIQCKDITNWKIIENPEYRAFSGAYSHQVINEKSEIIYEGWEESCKIYCGGIALNENHEQAKKFADEVSH